MSFLAVPFLFATLAAGIPVVLHMMNRQKAKHLPFPTLRFLKISVEKTRRRRRIQDLLLMLIRMALLILIALGLAKPTVTTLNSLFSGGARSAVAIVLDNSSSMGMIDQDRPRLETATMAADQVLRELGYGDQAALLVTCGPGLGDEDKLDRNLDPALQALSQCRVTYEKADLPAKLKLARSLLAKSSAINKQIYVISDFQALSWAGLKKEGAAGAEADEELSQEDKDALQIAVIAVDCNRAPRPNVAVQNVALEAAVPVAGLPVKATVELLNTSPIPQQRNAELYIDGNREQTSPAINLSPDGRASHTFLFAFQRGGLHRGEIRLAGDDGSKYDDRRFFSMEVDQGIPVAIVKPERHEISYLEDTFYLEQALSPGKSGGWAVQTTTLTAGDLVSEPLDTYKVIFCVNLPAPSADTAERLRNYVERGGNLVWICGDNVNPEAYNQVNQQAGGKLLPAPLLELRAPGPQDQRDSWHINFLDKLHPALAHLVEPVSLYESVLIYKHIRVDAGAAEARVLARLDDGEPLLVQRPVGEGKVLFLGTGAHIGWTNLPLRPIFLPLAARLTFYLSGAEQARHEMPAGAPLVLQLENEAAPVDVELLTSGGETFRLRTQEETGKKGQVFRYAKTQEPGVYVVRLTEASRPTQIAYSVNVDPDEADPTKIEREALREQLAPTPVVFAEDPDDLSSTFKTLREGKSLWGIFLTAVLVVLVFEVLVSNGLSPKQQEAETSQPPPGMRRLARRGHSPA